MRSSLEAKHLTEFGTKLVVDEIIKEVTHKVLMGWSFIGEMLKEGLIMLLLFKLRESGIERFEARHDLQDQLGIQVGMVLNSRH